MYLCGHKWYLATWMQERMRKKKSRNLIFLATENKEPMEKKSEFEKASAIIKFRIKGKEKDALQAEAKGKGISLIELLKARLYGRPARDRIYDKNLFASIDLLTREMNSIRRPGILRELRSFTGWTHRDNQRGVCTVF